MMTNTSCMRTVMEQTRQWIAVAGTSLLLGQAALAEDTVTGTQICDLAGASSAN